MFKLRSDSIENMAAERNIILGRKEYIVRYS